MAPTMRKGAIAMPSQNRVNVSLDIGSEAALKAMTAISGLSRSKVVALCLGLACQEFYRKYAITYTVPGKGGNNNEPV